MFNSISVSIVQVLTRYVTVKYSVRLSFRRTNFDKCVLQRSVPYDLRFRATFNFLSANGESRIFSSVSASVECQTILNPVEVNDTSRLESI